MDNGDLQKAVNTAKDYVRLVNLLRKLLPSCSITTDVLVGYPGETEDDFQKTYDLMKRIEFDSAFIFKYSPRPHTSALRLKDDVQRKVKEERNHLLLELQRRITKNKNKSLVGSAQEVLVEDINRKSKREVLARTRTDKLVVLDGSVELIGEIFEVKIESFRDNTLRGRK